MEHTVSTILQEVMTQKTTIHLLSIYSHHFLLLSFILFHYCLNLCVLTFLSSFLYFQGFTALVLHDTRLVSFDGHFMRQGKSYNNYCRGLKEDYIHKVLNENSEDTLNGTISSRQDNSNKLFRTQQENCPLFRKSCCSENYVLEIASTDKPYYCSYHHYHVQQGYTLHLYRVGGKKVHFFWFRGLDTTHSENTGQLSTRIRICLQIKQNM